MVKKEKSKKFWIIGIILVVLALYGGNQGWFKSINLFNIGGGQGSDNLGGNGDLDNAQSYINLLVSPGSPCLGDVVTGAVSSNLPSAVCYLQAKIGLSPWVIVGDSFILDQQGKYSASTTANNIGTVKFRVVCDTVVSNERSVTVTDCGNYSDEDVPENSCTDSDGGNNIYVQGTCTEPGYSPVSDVCVYNGVSTVLNEYTCEGTMCVSHTVSCPGMQDACSEGACWDLN